MAFSIKYKSSIKDDLKSIPQKEKKIIIDKIEKLLAENPIVYPKLKGSLKRLRKFRVGNYRVIYLIDADDIVILKIGNRKNVYDKIFY